MLAKRADGGFGIEFFRGSKTIFVILYGYSILLNDFLFSLMQKLYFLNCLQVLETFFCVANYLKTKQFYLNGAVKM